MNEMLLEDFWRLVHDMFAHDHKELSALESCDLSVSEVVLNDFYYCAHLLLISLEFNQNWRKCSGGS